MAKKFDFKRMLSEFRKKKRTLPIAIGNIAKNHFKQSFRNQGFTDRTLNPWAKRKKFDKKRPGRAVLIDSGDLRRSIKVLKATFSRILITTSGIVYGSYHNRGEGSLPKRKFMGKSFVVNNKIKRRIRREIKTIFR